MFNYRSNNGSLTKERDSGARNSAAAQTIGTQLRERREALGATLAEIESATKIRQKYLSALESDEWLMLPGEVIGRGFLRNYALYLGLESNELVERRRAITDPGTVNILSNTSSGVRLPTEREVDYRPREMDLREDPDVIESRQVSVGPYLVGLLAIALLALVAWSLFQYGGQIRDQLAGFFDSAGTMISSAMTPATPTPVPPTATSLPPTPTLEVPVAAPTAIAAAPPSGTSANAGDANSGSGQSDQFVLPTATNTPSEAVAPTATAEPPTPTPAPQVAILTTAANLRSGPGTNFDITTAGQPGQEVRIVAQSPDGQWYLLEDGAWVFAQLVANPPTNVPLQDVPATPTVPTAETPASPTEQPAAPPPAAVVPASCPSADAVISFPGVNQPLAGTVTVNGTANREPFQSWKVELNGVVVGTGNVPIVGGTLLSFDSNGFANGAGTLVLTSVDNTGNYSQCAVPVVIQN